MTLLEKIEAYVASQGNQVGGGSEFADLLKEIVNSIPQGGNEPLIVLGDIENDGGSYIFIPLGSTTIAEAKEAFEQGRDVILKASGNGITPGLAKVTSVDLTYANQPVLYGCVSSDQGAGLDEWKIVWK